MEIDLATELEKRAGLGLDEARQVKKIMPTLGVDPTQLKRTIAVKVENEDFSPDPAADVDVKIKLMDDVSLLSVKKGSWHADAARDELEVRFERGDLSSLVAIMSLVGFNRFIVFSTLRTTWRVGSLTVTLDEYQDLDCALFEIEAGPPATVSDIDKLFAEIGVTPMTSDETVAFIARLNGHSRARFDLTANATVSSLAKTMVALH